MKNYFFSKYCINWLLCSILVVLQPISSFSQTQNIVFQHITTKNGLSQNLVTAIIRDKRGFMWFATLNGLNFYNGYSIQVFKNDSSKNSISSNLINGICEDQNGDLWIATRNGLNKYIFDQNRFIHFLHDETNENSLSDNNLKCVYCDKKGNIWIGTYTKGLDKLFFNNGKPFFKHYTYEKDKPNFVTAERINCITEDHLGNIWIGTTDGLNKLDPKTEEIWVFKNNLINVNSLTNNSINTIFESNDRNLWVGTKLGLNRINIKNKSITRFYEDLNNPQGLLSSAIRWINQDIKGNILIGTLDGMHKYNPGSNNFFRFGYNPNGEFSLNNNFVSCIYCDCEGNVWVGTEKGGVNKYNIFQQKFYNILAKLDDSEYLNQGIVNSIFEDDSYIWVGTGGGGLNRYDKASKRFTYFMANPVVPRSISHNFISGITKDSYGNLWVATWGLGLNKLINNKKGTFTNISFATPNTDSINWNLISYMLEFPKGNLWLGSRLGLSRMDLKSAKISIINSLKFSDKKIFRTSCLLVDSRHNLWVGTEEGLFMLKWNNIETADLNKPDSMFCFLNDPKRKTSIASNHVLYMHEDKNKNLWFSIYGFGLNRIRPGNLNGNKTKFESFNRLNNIIYTVLEDDKQHLWLSTENGIQKFNPKDSSCQTFYESDGLQGNQFYWTSCYKNSKGQLLFGGLQGLTIFHPDSIMESKSIDEIIFTDFKIFNKSLSIDSTNKFGLQQNIYNTKTIRLKHNQNVFTIEFTGLNYDIQSLTQFAYKLEGFDVNWNYVDASRRNATYTNLPPGWYLFKVKAANRDGIWSKKEASIQIIIYPEWWQTLFFKISVVLLIIFISLFIYFRRIYNLKKQHRKLEMMVDHRTAQLQKQTLEILEQKNEILAQKDEILGQKDEISNQNIQLQKYGSKLEEMVYERTRELELAKNKAEESDRLKTSFLANLSHEIRTPLNAIVGFSTLIANSNPGVDPVKNWSGLVLKNNNYLLRLINDILDFAKIDSGQIEIENTKIMVSGLLSEVYETYKMKFDQKLLPLADKVDFNLCKVEGYTDIKLFSDRSLLVQVLNNLIENASKFTQKGFIEIGYKIQDNNVLFWVKDTGIGIAVENHNAIFERFRKIEDNKDALFRGTGLGLAIVKSLIEKLGGTIWVESQLGEGSTFYFTIPLKNE